ncbi:MAG TPA: ribonuclease PH [Myxococcota bacterium]
MTSTTVRADGRLSTDLRPISFETGYIRHHKGSVLVSFGNTKVLCVATAEERVPPHRKESGGGWVTAEYAMLPGSTHDRKQRERQKQDGRSVEIQRLIGRALRNVVDVDLIGPRQINVDCDVIQADGGTRTASITGGFVALALCIHDLQQRKLSMKAKTLRQAMPAQVAAVSLGVHGGNVLTDLCYSEDSAAETDLNLVARSDGGIVEVQGTAEGAPLARRELDLLVDQGLAAIEQLCALQREALGGLWS